MVKATACGLRELELRFPPRLWGWTGAKKPEAKALADAAVLATWKQSKSVGLLITQSLGRTLVQQCGKIHLLLQLHLRRDKRVPLWKVFCRADSREAPLQALSQAPELIPP